MSFYERVWLSPNWVPGGRGRATLAYKGGGGVSQFRRLYRHSDIRYSNLYTIHTIGNHHVSMVCCCHNEKSNKDRAVLAPTPPILPANKDKASTCHTEKSIVNICPWIALKAHREEREGGGRYSCVSWPGKGAILTTAKSEGFFTFTCSIHRLVSDMRPNS